MSTKLSEKTAPDESKVAAPATKRTDAEWKEMLTPEQFHVLREHGTERAFSNHHPAFEHEKAAFRCAGCGQELFSAEQKYDSGSGWPSFYAPVDGAAVETARDASHGMARVEVHCSRCAGHLGHVFNDGPEPTGLRYCINAVSLRPVVPSDPDAATSTSSTDSAHKG